MTLPSAVPFRTFVAPEIVRASESMEDILQLAGRAARSDAKVLITGESGTGKDLVARYIHAASARARGAFVAVNCAGLTETLLESELFGHLKGSFTGAYRDKAGKVQLAHRGTLFLDEVGDMSLRMQGLLLRFLESGEVQVVGAPHATDFVDVRIIAATNRSLDDLVAKQRFRDDLLYRLRVIHVHVPPLRDRPDDIGPLVHRFASRFRHGAIFGPAALAALCAHSWPGNVRELLNVVEHAVWTADGEVVEPRHLPASLLGRPSADDRERRRQVADDLYDAVVTRGYGFWEHVHPLLLSRDITRHDVRQLVIRGLTTTRGSFKALVRLFGMPGTDYKRFLNFLAAHDCTVDARALKHGPPEARRRPRVVLPALAADAGLRGRTGPRPDLSSAVGRGQAG